MELSWAVSRIPVAELWSGGCPEAIAARNSLWAWGVCSFLHAGANVLLNHPDNMRVAAVASIAEFMFPNVLLACHCGCTSESFGAADSKARRGLYLCEGNIDSTCSRLPQVSTSASDTLHALSFKGPLAPCSGMDSTVPALLSWLMASFTH